MSAESFLTRWFELNLIEDCNHDPYLSRWFLIHRKWLSVFIHKFHRSDEDRALHDHPWNYISIILRHGYWEHSKSGVEWIPEGSVIFRRGTWRHRIELDKGKKAWTLIIRFKRYREWGFWNGEQFTQWQDWWRANCE